MSVLIKDIDIPENCSDCPLNHDGMSCVVTGTRWWSDTMVLLNFDYTKERLYDCPLSEVPSPQPEQAVKGCRNCKYGKYNDHWKTRFCYNPNECTEWNLWEPNAQPEIKPIEYRECANAMLKMWIDNVLTDGEYNRIMDKLNSFWKERREDG